MKPFACLALAIAPFHAFAAELNSAPPAPSGLGGSPIAGLCMLSRPAVFANSKVGIASSARLKQLTQQVEAELLPERRALETERQSLAKGSGPGPADQQERSQAFDQHARAFAAKAQQRNRELAATKVKVLEKISASLQPIVAQVYRSRNCGILLDRGSVLGGTMTNDLTPQVVQTLDEKITSIPFDRETTPGETAPRP
jgi:Skp family chaperone for outer membrane proteins